MRADWGRVGPTSDESVFMKQKRMETHREKAEVGRDWRDAATSQQSPGSTRSWNRQARVLP